MTRRAAVPRHRMTDAERSLAKALRPGPVSYLPASSDKRIAHQLAERASRFDAEISDGERRQLLRLGHRYRRQLDSWTILLVERERQRLEARDSSALSAVG